MVNFLYSSFEFKKFEFGACLFRSGGLLIVI